MCSFRAKFTERGSLITSASSNQSLGGADLLPKRGMPARASLASAVHNLHSPRSLSFVVEGATTQGALRTGYWHID